MRGRVLRGVMGVCGGAGGGFSCGKRCELCCVKREPSIGADESLAVVLCAPG